MNKLVISLVSRGRPDILIPTINVTLLHIRHPNTVYQVNLDEDDQESIVACENIKGIVLSVKPREGTIAEKYNRALVTQADIYLTQADHTAMCTPGFDGRILEAASAFPDGIGAVHNHMANLSFSYSEAITAGMIEFTGGKIYEEYFPYWFIDHWTDDVAKLIGRIAFADFVADNTRRIATRELREPGWWGTWFDAAFMLRREQAHGIINSIRFHEPDWRKRQLLAHYPLIEARSVGINEQLRGQMGQHLSKFSGNLSLADSRYQRTRQRAVAMLPSMLASHPAEPDGIHWAAHQYRDYLTPPTQIINLKRA
jgi:hypothetical protein